MSTSPMNRPSICSQTCAGDMSGTGITHGQCDVIVHADENETINRVATPCGPIPDCPATKEYTRGEVLCAGFSICEESDSGSPTTTRPHQESSMISPTTLQAFLPASMAPFTPAASTERRTETA
ncbi:uncharacterized protein LOC109902292 isoform X1 [Oncorhynchus kisutch]|uniref:uncharacterized protein LOC109902292 isoform X1 n=1 Tax=Oncorhynchus kisutch TaxID=8019 RepID=UPI00099FD20F|nr:uncharacterized protein LOC109902292 isoform X1 [Oncorhynchus kisutch]XP_031642210.1 uncharacterized protein LOC109902292 isoform X1 [Oncorhynchus kisutch]XP_031642211.1 uncharacterized protein LOC109902292 isoform X1 [Oncorhynchus kisutch]XP_031642212.1 uncharacterized protein LOC109902292 isoform X1 [Oncorhynchus kisutch]